MKKTLVIILMSCLVLILVACGDGSGGAESIQTYTLAAASFSLPVSWQQNETTESDSENVRGELQFASDDGYLSAYCNAYPIDGSFEDFVKSWQEDNEKYEKENYSLTKDSEEFFSFDNAEGYIATFISDDEEVAKQNMKKSSIYLYSDGLLYWFESASIDADRLMNSIRESLVIDPAKLGGYKVSIEDAELTLHPSFASQKPNSAEENVQHFASSLDTYTVCAINSEEKRYSNYDNLKSLATFLESTIFMTDKAEIESPLGTTYYIKGKYQERPMYIGAIETPTNFITIMMFADNEFPEDRDLLKDVLASAELAEAEEDGE